jgi:hypothetical protein
MMATDTAAPPKPAAKKRAAKKKPAAKPPADQTTNEEGGGVAATPDQTAENTAESSKKERPYRVTRELKLDLTDPGSIMSQLLSIVGPLEEGVLPPPITVHAVIGTGNGGTPKEGLTDLAQKVDLSGDYQVVSEANVVTFAGVVAQTKRVLTVG